jgi:hypothetical protein
LSGFVERQSSQSSACAGAAASNAAPSNNDNLTSFIALPLFARRNLPAHATRRNASELQSKRRE